MRSTFYSSLSLLFYNMKHSTWSCGEFKCPWKEIGMWFWFCLALPPCLLWSTHFRFLAGAPPPWAKPLAMSVDLVMPVGLCIHPKPQSGYSQPSGCSLRPFSWHQPRLHLPCSLVPLSLMSVFSSLLGVVCCRVWVGVHSVRKDKP